MSGVVCGSMARTVMSFASRGSWFKCKCTCAVCHSDVGANYVECSQWKSWVHKRRSSISNWLVAYPVYTCPGCDGKDCPIDSTPVTEVAVDCTMLDVEAIFCYLRDMLWPFGGCDSVTDSRFCVAWREFRKLLAVLITWHLSLKGCGKMCLACARSSMLHGNETWGQDTSDLQQLHWNDRAMIH